MVNRTEVYVVEMNIGGVFHKDEVRSSNTHSAAKKAAAKIKNTISKMECTKPSAKVYRRDYGSDPMYAEFPDLRLIL